MNLQQSHLKAATDCQGEVSAWQRRFESVMDQRLPTPDENPGILHEAMRYSALAGGKRFRPVLVYAAGTALGAPQGSGRGHGPPEEAIQACEGMNAGDTVEFETPRGDTVSGICREIRDQLVAVPEGGPPGRGRGGRSRGNDG